MKRDSTSKGGVRFHITREMIRDYRKMPPEMRLKWLAEAAEFSYRALTPERKLIWEKFRKGTL